MDDPLTDAAALDQPVANWCALLRTGLEAMDGLASVKAIEARSRTGRPLASPEWIAEAEAAMARKLAPRKCGPKERQLGGNWYCVPGICPEFAIRRAVVRNDLSRHGPIKLT